MGKWSPDGLDYVLTGKMMTAVDSVNARIRLDTDPGAAPTQPTITYDQFVEDLDLGDSFTSVLFECLIKEMAERRKRKSTSDKRMISRRTQKLLQNLSHSTRVLRDRDDSRLAFRRNMYAGPGWGAVDLEGSADVANWINDWPEDDLVAPSRPSAATGGATTAGDDSDDMWTEDASLDPHLTSAGTRELHESYYSSTRGGPFRAARWPVLSRPTLDSEDWTLPTIYRTASAGNTPGATASSASTVTSASNTQGQAPVSASGASVTRQASLRRAGRQRLDAFNDYATRRRLNTRFDAETSTASDRAEAASALAAYHAGAAAAINRSAVWDNAPPPWVVNSGVGPSSITSSSRALSGNSRLRRLQQLQAQAHAAAVASTSSSVPSSVAGTPDPTGMYLLRSVSPTPAPPAVPGSEPVVASRGVETGLAGDVQLLTPRSTTPTEDTVTGSAPHVEA